MEFVIPMMTLFPLYIALSPHILQALVLLPHFLIQILVLQHHQTHPIMFNDRCAHNGNPLTHGAAAQHFRYFQTGLDHRPHLPLEYVTLNMKMNLYESSFSLLLPKGVLTSNISFILLSLFIIIHHLITMIYRDAYTTLAGQVALKQPASAAGAVTAAPKIIAPLNQGDYPLVKFWYASEWKKFSENELAVSGGDEGKSSPKNVAQRYIEDSQGTVVDRDRARKIRSIAHQIFFDLRNTGRTQSKWSECGLGATEWFNTEMAHQVPEMRLCSEHWKAHKLATYLFPSWNNTHGTGKPAAIKDEVVDDVRMIDVEVPGAVMNPAVKRSLDEQGPTKKKPRKERRQKKVEASPLTVQISKSTS
jgi:hypothetical protein